VEVYESVLYIQAIPLKSEEGRRVVVLEKMGFPQ